MHIPFEEHSPVPRRTNRSLSNADDCLTSFVTRLNQSAFSLFLTRLLSRGVMLDYKSTSNPGFQDSPRKEENAHLELTLSYASGRQKVTRQAESNARAVDPNEGRCLIENCDEARAVVFAHYVPRCLSDKKHLVLSMVIFEICFCFRFC